MRSRDIGCFQCGVLIVAGLLVSAVLSACTPKEKSGFSETSWADQVATTRAADLYAPHFEDGRFFAPWMPMPDKSFLDVVWWKLFSTSQYSDEEQAFLPAVLPDAARRLAQTQGDFILWIGHNTFLVRVGDTYWLTDPIFSKRALVPARVTPPAVTLEDINRLVPEVNILISHNHYDHLDRSSMKQLPADARVFVPLGLKNMVEKMNKTTVHEMDWWEEYDLGKGFRLICSAHPALVPAYRPGPEQKPVGLLAADHSESHPVFWRGFRIFQRDLRNSAGGSPASTMRSWPPPPTIPGGSWPTTT
jgi:N-acyl-phosphatidylethanolamine-hydrolysing phospholipase D